MKRPPSKPEKFNMKIISKAIKWNDSFNLDRSTKSVL